MVAAPFEYVSVTSYAEAVDALRACGEDAKLLAGGQSLVPMMNLRLVRPGVLVDLNRIPSLQPRLEGSTVCLDALTRHRTLTDDPVVAAHCPLLAEAVRHVGNVRVRVRGTIGGSLAHGDPTAEIGAVAVAVDAEVEAAGPGGRRTIPARDLFVTYLTTSLHPGEVVTGVRVPAIGPREGWGFREMVRRSADLAIVAVAACVRLDAQLSAEAAAVSLAGVADRVVLADASVAAGVLGTDGRAAVLADVARRIAGGIELGSDVHASAGYRRRLVEVLTRRALGDAFTCARANAGEAG